MAKSATQLQAESDARRGVKTKGIKMPIATIALLESLSRDTGKPQNQIVVEAIELWANQQS